MNNVSAPTPLLDYTLRYNMRKENIDSAKLRDIKADAEFEKDKLVKLQSARRLAQDRAFNDHVEDIRRYEATKLSREHQEYQYQYYLGTKVDMYI